MVDDAYRAINRTPEQIRRSGAIGNLNEGVEIITHGISTRLIAWPGNGFQTESLHVLTLKPGDESPMYRYAISEEGVLCLKGKGEVFIRGQWAAIEAGDMAYFPDNVVHAMRNPRENQADFVLVSSISPPSLDLYEADGYYSRKLKSMDFDKAERARQQVTPGSLSAVGELHFNDSHPELRAWNLTQEDIRRNGALFNFYSGARFGGLGGAMRLILWPGYGVGKTGFHSATAQPREGPNAVTRMLSREAGRAFRAILSNPRPHPLAEEIAVALEKVFSNAHTHPVSDEVVVSFQGSCRLYCGDRWIPAGPNDCVMAPCGVAHGAFPNLEAAGPVWLGGGFAAPPQLDIYMETDYYKDGSFEQPPFEPYRPA